MIGRHKRLVVAAIVAVLLVAMVATAVMAETPTPTPGAESSGQGVKYGQVFLDKLAALLKIDRSTLDSAIKDAGKQTADEAVQNGDLTQKQADSVKERIDQGAPGFLGKRGWGGMMGGRVPHGFAAKAPFDGDTVINAVAEKLGMTADELKAQLKACKRLADIAKEKNVSEQDLRAAVVSAIKPRLDQAVADGDLTQKQADRIISSIQDGKFPLMFGWGRGFKIPATSTPGAAS